MGKSISDEDSALFREAVDNLRRLKNKKSFSANETPEYPFSDFIKTYVSAEEILFFARPGLQNKLIRSLRQGKISLEADLDLHKMTVPQARKALSDFLAYSVLQGYRCVRIIHGKSRLSADKPVLKNHVYNWLQQHEDVLALCSAVSKDGGAGAVYVLLRKGDKPPWEKSA
jgi:DNA-nicking Smr family endonuclease